MSRQIYQWERYWYPCGVDPPVSPDGFLYNHIPLSKDESLLRFEEIAGVPCLILLGEPGIGKSYAMENAYLALKDTETVDDRYYYINLKKFSEYELVQELDDVFRDWSSNEYHLQLFLDSLDEARVRISTVTHILTRRLERFASVVTSRLSLRVACRVADWPADLEEGLQKFWNEETAVRAYVLAPLQRQDVEEAANANNIEPKAFLHEIIQKEVGVLACYSSDKNGQGLHLARE